MAMKTYDEEKKIVDSLYSEPGTVNSREASYESRKELANIIIRNLNSYLAGKIDKIAT